MINCVGFLAHSKEARLITLVARAQLMVITCPHDEEATIVALETLLLEWS